MPVADAAPNARVVITGPAYDSPGARVPLIVTILNGPRDLAAGALRASATAGGEVVDCGPSWRNPALRSLSRSCFLIAPRREGSLEVTGHAEWTTPDGSRVAMRSAGRVFRMKGPPSAPVSLADAEGINGCGNTGAGVWLTFDDVVPSLATARSIVQVLDRNAARGRFFLNRVTPQIRDVLESAGHVVTNHTRDHLALSDLSDAELKRQVDEGLTTTAGFPKLLRPPYGAGSFSARVVAGVAAAGHATCRWTVDTRDYADVSAETMHAAVRWGDQFTPPAEQGGVILMHANHFDPPELQAVIDAVRERGLTLDPNPERTKTLPRSR